MPLDPAIPLSVQLPQITSPAQLLAQRAAIQGAQQDQQLRQQQITLNQQQIQGQSALADVLSSTPMVSQGGAKLYDIPAITQKLAAKGLGAQAESTAQHLTALNDATLSAYNSQLGLVRQGAQSIQASGNDPQLASLWIDQQLRPFVGDQAANQLLGQIKQDPSLVGKLTSYYAGPTKPVEVSQGSKLVNPNTGAVVAEGAPKPPTEPELAVRAAQGDKAAQDALDKLHAMTPYQQAELKTQSARLLETMRHNKQIEGNGINADDPKAAGAIEALGTFMAQTGRMPVGFRVYGQGSAAFYTAVANKANEVLKAQGSDLATNAAQYGANEGSLKKLQATYDATQAFLETADRNSELLKTTLQKLPDINSPIFNRPLRVFAANVKGDPNMAQFATFLTSVQNEYAKILSNPSMSGQLTDSMRHEAQALVSPAATVPQIVKSLDALAQEGHNRLTSLADQIKTVRGRTSSASGPPAADMPAVGTRRLINGQPAKWDGKGWLPDPGGTP